MKIGSFLAGLLVIIFLPIIIVTEIGVWIINKISSLMTRKVTK